MPRLADRGFWLGRRVLLTGHTGFKGSWLTLCLKELGADIHGLALPPATDPSLFELAGVGGEIAGRMADIRDLSAVADVIGEAAPQIVIHMAAQSLVRRSARDPLTTFSTNVMGTANLLQALRNCAGLEAVLVVTSDKVYEQSLARPFRESDPLGFRDPYSSSKAATELIAGSFARSYFDALRVPVATARSGNVIGGGDFSEDRLVPDIHRAIVSGTPLAIRNPLAVRPWRYVLDCICGYLAYVEALALRCDIPLSLNFAPDPKEKTSVMGIVEAMQVAFDQRFKIAPAPAEGPAEVDELILNASLARETLGWTDFFQGDAMIRATADWYRALDRGDDMGAYSRRAVKGYLLS